MFGLPDKFAFNFRGYDNHHLQMYCWHVYESYRLFDLQLKFEFENREHLHLRLHVQCRVYSDEFHLHWLCGWQI